MKKTFSVFELILPKEVIFELQTVGSSGRLYHDSGPACP